MLKFANLPIEGLFQQRYKRFFADVDVNGETVVAHVANTGSLKSCLYAGEKALISPSQNPARKLKFSLEALQTPWGTWVGVNTSWPNVLVKKLFADAKNPDWLHFKSYKPEHKISKETRLDGLLEGSAGQLRFVEIKNVTFATGACEAGQGTARFPDAKTERGKKHLDELMNLVSEGHEAEMIFVVQRNDCVEFCPAWDVDPEYAETLLKAVEAGVKVSVWPVHVSKEGLELRADQPLTLNLQRPKGLLPTKKTLKKKKA